MTVLEDSIHFSHSQQLPFHLTASSDSSSNCTSWHSWVVVNHFHPKPGTSRDMQKKDAAAPAVTVWGLFSSGPKNATFLN